MKQTDLFFSAAVDLKYHSFSEPAKNAMYTVYDACKSINQPNKYGASIDTIIIDAILQDYPSKFHPASIEYDSIKKTVEAGVKVDLDKVLNSNFLEMVAVYQDVIFCVLDHIKDQAPDYDFAGLKRDLRRAIQAEIGVAE